MKFLIMLLVLVAVVLPTPALQKYATLSAAQNDMAEILKSADTLLRDCFGHGSEYKKCYDPFKAYLTFVWHRGLNIELQLKKAAQLEDQVDGFRRGKG